MEQDQKEARIIAEQEKIEAEKRAIAEQKEKEGRQAEIEKARKESAEKARMEAEKKAAREVEEKRLAEIQAKKEEALRLALMPDKEKLSAYADELQAIPTPSLSHKQSHEILSKAIHHIEEACKILKKGGSDGIRTVSL
jgi:hypothetical protein